MIGSLRMEEVGEEWPVRLDMPHYALARRTLERLEIGKENAVLDIGCGDGFHFRLAHDRSARVLVAIDISARLLRTCARRFARDRSLEGKRVGEFVAGDALRLPFADESFDRIICSLVLYLLPLRESLRELARVLEPGGKVYLRVPMWSWGRAVSVFGDLPNLKMLVYGMCHVWNGLYYAVAGRQCGFSLTRACYVPRGRLLEALQKVGFEVEHLEIDRARRWRPSMDAWVTKTGGRR